MIFFLFASLLARSLAEELSDAISLELAADDECSDETCALNALQLRSLNLGPTQDMLNKISAAMKAKLPDINEHVAQMMKSKDPMTVHINKGQVNFDKLYGISGLHINSMKADAFHEPNMVLSISGSWSGTLKIVGAADKMGRHVPVDVTLHGVSFYTNSINMQFNQNTLSIDGFHIDTMHVNIGSASVSVHLRIPFFARVISNMASGKVNQAKGQIAGKMADKLKSVLSMVLNAKMKAAINGKIKEKMR